MYRFRTKVSDGRERTWVDSQGAFRCNNCRFAPVQGFRGGRNSFFTVSGQLTDSPGLKLYACRSQRGTPCSCGSFCAISASGRYSVFHYRRGKLLCMPKGGRLFVCRRPGRGGQGSVTSTLSRPEGIASAARVSDNQRDETPRE